MKFKGIYRMPGSRFFWYRWALGGKRYAVSLKTDDLAEAIQKARGIQEGTIPAQWAEKLRPSRTLLTKLVEDYLTAAKKRRKRPMRPDTAKRQEFILLKFLKDSGAESVMQITHGAISQWLDGLQEVGRGADTLHTYARSLHTFVMYLVERKLISPDIDFDIPERAAVGRKNWLKNKEVQRVIAESKEQDLTFILYCGFHAGLRRNEICHARVGWFDLEASLIHVQNDPETGFVLKDRENRTVGMTGEFRKFLAAYLKGKGPRDYALRPDKLPGKSRYRCEFSKAVKAHCERCGVTCCIHDMRRSFASNLVSSGESIYIVARWLGDGVQVVERSYGHLAPSAGNINRLATP
jgi:integrase